MSSRTTIPEIRQIYDAVTRANRVLLIGHRQPDADALGCLAAFGLWLEGLGKQVVCYAPEKPDRANLFFLTETVDFFSTPERVLESTYDAVVVFDSGDLKYAGVDQWLPNLLPTPLLINIDHHQTNQRFGVINWVATSAASTTEMLYQFFSELRIELTTDIANALLAGIIFDTYNFTNSNTSAETMKVASRLLRQGAKLSEVSRAVLQSKPLPAMRVWGGVLARLTKNEELGIATAIITQADLEPLAQNAKPDEVPSPEVVEGIANFLNSLGGVRVAMVLRELPDGRVKGSLRTNDDLIDVAKLAKLMGGGGHKKAAGFTVPGRLEQMEGKWRIV